MEKGDIDALKKYSFERKNAVYRVRNSPFRHHRPYLVLLTRDSSVVYAGRMFL